MVETILMWAGIVVACLIACLNIIAPITKSDYDNKALAFLRKFEELVLKLLIPQMRAILAAAKDEKPKK